ncbi:NAD(P)H-binding protein [Actinoallomurus sp. NPDC052308]|uniref:NAD(P)H-binding protein n=1 Tax=Actinoallomurus sp. NPDC052308 TaxID=3155530 RepID=UPI00341ECA3A
MIVVFGSTGTVGRQVVTGLVAAGRRVRAVTRDPARASFDAAVEVVRADITEPGSVLAAIEGADAVYMATAPEALAHERTVADAVRRTGTGRVVKLSSVAALPPVLDSYGAAHAAGERAFAESGAGWTVLRSAGFMSNVLQWGWSIHSAGAVYQPYGMVPRALIAPEDVAAAAIVCLTTRGHDGKTYQLTGPEALTGPEQTERVAAAIGRPLRFVDADPEQARQGMIGAGMPEDLTDGLLASMADRDPRRGGTPLPTVRELTGRPPTRFDTWLAEHVGELAPAETPAG